MKPIERFSGTTLKENSILEAIIGTGEKNSPKFGIYLDSFPWRSRYVFADRSNRESGNPQWLSFEVNYMPADRSGNPFPRTFIKCGISIDKEGIMTGIEPSNGLVHYTPPSNNDGSGVYYSFRYFPAYGNFNLCLQSISELFRVSEDIRLNGSVYIKSEKARQLLSRYNLTPEIDTAKTVEMYLTGRTPKGKPLTPEAILNQPLIPAPVK